MSLFSGIGAFEKALRNLHIDFELVGYSEIDKYASKAYSLIHNVPESLNLGDITKIDETALEKNVDLITYGFPCQDISVAGKRKGFSDGKTKTRSGLFFDALRVIQAIQPKIAIAENVKNLTGKRFKNEFETVLNSLRLAGYNNYHAVLNARDYGIPQSRERVFIISIHKSVDNNKFVFPKSKELNKRLKDMLEDTVDEKYYIKNANMTVINDSFDSTDRLMQVGILDMKGFDMIKRVYSVEGLCPTINTCQGGNTGVKIITQDSQIRRITPKERFRLMGFEDKDIDVLIDNNISNTQLDKMSGNSIVVNVLEEIFKSLIDTQIIHTEKREAAHGLI